MSRKRHPKYVEPVQLGFDWGLIERQDLPESMIEIVDEVGLEGVRFLAEHFGGSSLHVRKLPSRLRNVRDLRADDFHGWMAELVALDRLGLARRLVRVVGGCILYIPSAREIEIRAIARRVRTDYDGRNAATLAARYHVGYRWVIDHALRTHKPKQVCNGQN